MSQLVMDATTTEINPIYRYSFVFSDAFWSVL